MEGMTRTLYALALLTASTAFAHAQNTGVLGDWREPGGSVIRVAPCGPDVCARLIQISSQAPSPLDLQNPDEAKRSQRLCGLQIGTGFQRKDPDHAEDGLLYDPKTGKTYHGEMTREGGTLHLRGYVGFKLFGRTENWTHISGLKATCAAAST